MKRSTLTDVARATGLSITTISRVLNGKAEEFRISKASQELIFRTIKSLNYRPNHAAQSLRNSSTHTIGLLVPRIDNPFFANIASIIIQEANKYSYPVMVIDTCENPLDEERALDTLVSRSVDGIIMAPCTDNPAKISNINLQIPVVLIDRYFEDENLPYVATDNYAGAYNATSMLIAAGHSNILCVQGSPLSITSRKRVLGYCDAMTKAGLEANIDIRGNDFSIQNGYIETKMALNSGRPFTAIFSLSSTILLGSMKAVQEHGLTVPTDISMLSFDNNTFLDYMNPPITRVCQPVDYIGIMAVKMLMDTIRGGEIKQKEVLLPPSIITGNSIAGPHNCESLYGRLSVCDL
jgi:LacI family transcriptional regulator